MRIDHERYRTRLGELIDEILPEAERAEIERHVEGCDECAVEVEAYLSLREDARALPREIAPPRDLWPAIAARITEGGDEKVVDLASRRSARRALTRWVPLAAAAMLLVVLSSGITFMLTRGPAAAPEVADRSADPRGRATTAFAAFEPVEREYLSTVEALEAQLESRRAELAPETITVIEANLAIIDQAIQEARAALAADPSSADLPLHLSDIYRTKVELLSTAVAL